MNLFPVFRVDCIPFNFAYIGLMWGAYFCKGAYKRNPDVVIKMGAYVHWVHILYGRLLFQSLDQ